MLIGYARRGPVGEATGLGETGEIGEVRGVRSGELGEVGEPEGSRGRGRLGEEGRGFRGEGEKLGDRVIGSSTTKADVKLPRNQTAEDLEKLLRRSA